jgi:peptide/nickel transport system permease protein
LAAMPEQAPAGQERLPRDEGPEPLPPRRNLFWVRLARHRLAVVGLGVLALLYLMAIFAPVLSHGVDPDALNLLQALQGPSPAHIMGTDNYGRDIWTRILYGGRISLTVGLVSVGIALVVGTVIGSAAGYYGGLVDSVLMRFTDAVLSFPTLFLLIAIVAIIGPSVLNIFGVIGLTSWPGIARFVRAEFLSLRERDFVEAARAAGATPRRIMFRHILPNAVAPVIVSATLGIAFAILTEAALDFIGVGLQPPTASWGTILNASQAYLLAGDWWFAVFPGLFIVVAVLSVNLVGDALQEAFNPRAMQRR